MGLPTADQLAAAPLTIVVLGPGFGESIVLRAAAEDVEWAVIDSARRQRRGRSVNPAVDLLKGCDARPSLVMLTHPHADHTKGMANIVEFAAPGATIACVEPLLIAPSPLAPSLDPDDMNAVARSQTMLAHAAIGNAWAAGFVKWSALHGSDTFRLADWSLSVLHPDDATVAEALDRYQQNKRVNLNDLSAALLVARDDVALVLGADGERKAWKAVEKRMLPDHLRATRPVKVPHHGSREAIQPVLIDHTLRDSGRPQIVTPFPKSGTLPRFDEDHGVERLLAASGAMDLTAMPVELIPKSEEITVADVRSGMGMTTFEGDPELEIRLDEPEGNAHLEQAERDPYETWVMAGVHHDGRIEITRGAHALRITE